MEQAPEVGTKEEQAYTLQYLQQLYQNQYSAIANDMNRSVQYLNELNGVQKTLESAPMANGKDALISIGANAYINSKVKKLDSILVGVGAGYVVEKDIEEAKGFIVGKVEKVTALFNRLLKNRNELRDAIVDVTSRLDALNQK